MAKLKEYVNKNLEGVKICTAYSLQLEHSLMGYFPAVFVENLDNIVICLSHDLIEKVRNMLPKRKSKIDEITVLVDTEKGIAFDLRLISHLNLEEAFDRESLNLLSEEDFNKLTKNGNKPFRWAPGLIGG